MDQGSDVERLDWGSGQTGGSDNSLHISQFCATNSLSPCSLGWHHKSYRELNPGTPAAEPVPRRAGAGPADCAPLTGSGGTACRSGSLWTGTGLPPPILSAAR